MLRKQLELAFQIALFVILILMAVVGFAEIINPTPSFQDNIEMYDRYVEDCMQFEKYSELQCNAYAARQVWGMN